MFEEASWYDKNSPIQFRDGLRLMELAKVKKGNKVLDFGCGTGNLTVRLAEIVGSEGKVVGVDPDADRLKLARETYSASNLEYVHGSAEEIPGGDYDIIFSNHAMHYLPDKNAVIEIFASKLKKGCKLVYTICIEDQVGRFADRTPGLYGIKFRDAWAAFYHYTSAEDCKQYTTVNNFVIDHSEIFTCRYHYENVEKLVEFRKTHIRGEYDDSEFNREAMRKEYGDGPFHHDYDYLLVVATYNGD